MEPFVKKKGYLAIAHWEEINENLVAGFSLKGSDQEVFANNLALHVHDRPENVQNNRQALAEILHFPLTNWVGAQQTHGKHVACINQEDKGRGSCLYEDALLDTDGLYTIKPDILLTLFFADCVPIFFIHPEKKQIGLAHAGWQGTALAIAKKMVDQWKIHDHINPHEIKAVIGPSICQNCYQVDQRVIDRMRRNLSKQEFDQSIKKVNEKAWQIDLKQINYFILRQAGIMPENIKITHFCTKCDDRLFFSHRGDQGKTGRMMAFIGWRN